MSGERVALRRHSSEILHDIFALIFSNRERLTGFLPWTVPQPTLASTNKWLIASIEDWDGSVIFEYGIYVRETEALVGAVSAHTISWENRRCELGFWVAREHEGKGHVTEAIRLLEAECFRVGFHRIEIRCNQGNYRSARVALNNGYCYEGSLRANVFENQQFVDTWLFAKVHSAT